MLSSTRQQHRYSGLLALLAVVSATPAFAKDANFEGLTLPGASGATRGVVSGYTGGSYSLSSIANRDRHNNECFGYGDRSPDHILKLDQDFAQLKLKVNSGRKGTTLLVKGPDNDTIRCGGETESRRDAQIIDSDWKSGTYQIWVGAVESGQRLDYTLLVREQQ